MMSYRHLPSASPAAASVAKRFLDVVVSAAALLLLAPVLAVIGLCVRCFLGEPALFRQRRPGYRERPFVMWKFRTMRTAVSAAGVELPDRERLTPFGRLLRRSSLDELPELWNVIKGEMSLVGPRPLRMDYLAYFESRERLRFAVRPGITGWAQIHGRNLTPWDERLARDVWYVENWSFWLDVRILFGTVARILKPDDVIADPSSVLRNFDEERRERRMANA